MLCDEILEFYFKLPKPTDLPDGIEIIYPFEDEETKRVMRLFFKKYYSDTNPRHILFGINPGRNGAGMTGVGFTDPVLMEEVCGIPNTLEKTNELSASFICEVVEAYGGPKKFYGDFLFATVLPFGLLKNGRNYNYYDDAKTVEYFKPFIYESVQKQMTFSGIKPTIATIGQGKNLDFLKKLNNELELFDHIEILPHPRWVMQYRRKEKERYIKEYIEVLAKLHSHNLTKKVIFV